MIAGTERFIALAIRLVRIVPDAPTIIPATIIAVLFNAMPVAAADSPVNALSKEITTGMSAPPIGSTTMFPSSAAANRIPMMNSAWECTPAASTIAEPTQITNSVALMIVWPGSLIGFPGRISWSFPNAMFEPQNETDPTIAANSVGICDFSTQNDPPERKWWRYSIQAMIATAPPPTPLNIATICGIAVIRTFRAAGTPTAVPITNPKAISHGVLEPLKTCGVSSVATIAIAMPTAAILLPRTAVRGPVSPLRP